RPPDAGRPRQARPLRLRPTRNLRDLDGGRPSPTAACRARPPPRDPGAFWQAPFRGPTFRRGRRPRAAGARLALRAKRPLTHVAKLADDAGRLVGCVVPADLRQNSYDLIAS